MINADRMSKMLLSERRQWSLKGALSSGSTLLNLACTEDRDSAFLRGGYYFLVGDSVSGKTWLSLSFLAEASVNPAFDKYRLIYDDVEGGALMDKQQYFGTALSKRLESPAVRKGKPRYSRSVEDFYFNVSEALDSKRPFIYVLDSQDALSSSYSEEKFESQKKAFETGREVAGSYGDGKAKYHSEHLRQVLSGLRCHDSILIVIGQTRDNLGFGFEKKTRSGGRALRFYANIEIWTSVSGKIQTMVRGKVRTIGVNVQAEVRKNRVTGKVGRDRAVSIPIYYGLGIDDVGSCVDFLMHEGHWKKVKDCRSVYRAREFGFKGTKEKIIKFIEAENKERKLRQIAFGVWKEIEDACAPKRKPRYA